MGEMVSVRMMRRYTYFMSRRLYYQGHGSYRITTLDGYVIYVDPFAGDGYDLPADLILVTHDHPDHNKVDLPARKADCRVITAAEALAGGRHNSFDLGWMKIEATAAENANHDPAECAGYLLSFDGLRIYAAGDTSTTKQMAELADENIDYALLPTDGFYNMDLAEAAECAKLIKAKHNIPIHMVKDSIELYDFAAAQSWTAPDKLLVKPGEEIVL
jgi:L-ascorbate metabolism protein UlaG (beta-lactamase superfamily)